mmetsp:Transcript_15429/g.36637  ORF Transcript_15429/g.36637 Transcript_15429/m.36637 type:complete len:271 (+) Transcript_15429:518-1330(+)
MAPSLSIPGGLLLLVLGLCQALKPGGSLTRRHVLAGVGASLGGLNAAAAIADGGGVATAAIGGGDDARARARTELLATIAAGRSDAEIMANVAALVPFDPSRGRGAVDASLAGTWDLVWTHDEAPALVKWARRTLHQPVGTQLLGEASASFGPGRVAQLLDVGGVRFELSSGATPADDDARVIRILPPFRFAALAGGRRFELAATEDDAGFRKLNARSAEAVAAPRNRYAQEYLETSGRVGDLRISRITEGDTAIVGNVYIHQRIPNGSR